MRCIPAELDLTERLTGSKRRVYLVDEINLGPHVNAHPSHGSDGGVHPLVKISSTQKCINAQLHLVGLHSVASQLWMRKPRWSLSVIGQKCNWLRGINNSMFNLLNLSLPLFFFLHKPMIMLFWLWFCRVITSLLINVSAVLHLYFHDHLAFNNLYPDDTNVRNTTSNNSVN